MLNQEASSAPSGLIVKMIEVLHTRVMNLSLTSRYRVTRVCTRVYRQVVCKQYCSAYAIDHAPTNAGRAYKTRIGYLCNNEYL